MSKLLELAERCEKAEGPDRRLDALISIALDPDRQVIVGAEPGRFPQKAIYGPVTELIDMAETGLDPRDAANYLSAPLYTASLDAALTLVREGYGYEIVNAHGKPYANVWKRDGGDWDDSGDVEAASPALALCAAALCALASQEDQSKAVGA